MKQIGRRPIVDLEPQGTAPEMSLARRFACGFVAALLAGGGLYLVTAPKMYGLAMVMGGMMLFGAVVLAGSALFPRLSFQKLDRSRWR